MNAGRQRRLLLLFVDGVGLGEADPAVNPIMGGACPRLRALLERHAVPIDAALGVPGLPQSATGQTALLTGANAPRLAGRHVEGFPGPALQDLIARENLFAKLKAMGRTCTFANAYYVGGVDEIGARWPKSVTTCAALSGLGAVRMRDLLGADRAVYQDLTREGLRARGYEGPLVEPEAAAEHLLAIAREHDFTLFEYFQTDRAGHAADRAAAERVLGLFDRFLGPLVAAGERGEVLLLLTSDHGNIEDLRARTHTANPVPFAAVGPGAEALRARVRDLTDVTPAILEHLRDA